MVDITIEWLNKAIADERDAIEMYTEAERSAESVILATMFHNIAVQEMEHLQQLEELRDRRTKGECPV